MPQVHMRIFRDALLLLTLCAAQVMDAQNPPIRQRKDINTDGHQDSLCVDWDGGSGFGSTTIIIVNGRTRERLTFEDDYCFCTITELTLVPESFLRPENAAFRRAAEEYLHTPYRAMADPSLTFVLSGLRSRRSFDKDPDSPYRAAFAPIMSGGKGQFSLSSIPQSYSIHLGEAQIRNLQAQLHRESEDSLVPRQEGWISYAAQAHLGTFLNETLPIKEMDTLNGRTLMATAHGLVLQDQDQWRWIWVTDHYLTGAPDKLRWSSVHHAYFLDEDHVLIQYTSSDVSAKSLALIDWKASRVTILNEPAACSQCDLQRHLGQLLLAPSYATDEPTLPLDATAIRALADAAWQ